MISSTTYATNLYCARCSKTYSLDEVNTLCTCGKPLLVTYDYQRAGGALKRNAFARGKSGMWEYGPLLPVRGDISVVYTAASLQPRSSWIDESFRFVGPSINPEIRAGTNY